MSPFKLREQIDESFSVLDADSMACKPTDPPAMDGADTAPANLFAPDDRSRAKSRPSRPSPARGEN